MIPTMAFDEQEVPNNIEHSNIDHSITSPALEFGFEDFVVSDDLNSLVPDDQNSRVPDDQNSFVIAYDQNFSTVTNHDFSVVADNQTQDISVVADDQDFADDDSIVPETKTPPKHKSDRMAKMPQGKVFDLNNMLFNVEAKERQKTLQSCIATSSKCLDTFTSSTLNYF